MSVDPNSAYTSFIALGKQFGFEINEEAQTQAVESQTKPKEVFLRLKRDKVRHTTEITVETKVGGLKGFGQSISKNILKRGDAHKEIEKLFEAAMKADDVKNDTNTGTQSIGKQLQTMKNKMLGVVTYNSVFKSLQDLGDRLLATTTKDAPNLFLRVSKGSDGEISVCLERKKVGFFDRLRQPRNSLKIKESSPEILKMFESALKSSEIDKEGGRKKLEETKNLVVAQVRAEYKEAGESDFEQFNAKIEELFKRSAPLITTEQARNEITSKISEITTLKTGKSPLMVVVLDDVIEKLTAFNSQIKNKETFTDQTLDEYNELKIIFSSVIDAHQDIQDVDQAKLETITRARKNLMKLFVNQLENETKREVNDWYRVVDAQKSGFLSAFLSGIRNIAHTVRRLDTKEATKALEKVMETLPTEFENIDHEELKGVLEKFTKNYTVEMDKVGAAKTKIYLSVGASKIKMYLSELNSYFKEQVVPASSKLEALTPPAEYKELVVKDIHSQITDKLKSLSEQIEGNPPKIEKGTYIHDLFTKTIEDLTSFSNEIEHATSFTKKTFDNYNALKISSLLNADIIINAKIGSTETLTDENIYARIALRGLISEKMVEDANNTTTWGYLGLQNRVNKNRMIMKTLGIVDKESAKFVPAQGTQNTGQLDQNIKEKLSKLEALKNNSRFQELIKDTSLCAVLDSAISSLSSFQSNKEAPVNISYALLNATIILDAELGKEETEANIRARHALMGLIYEATNTKFSAMGMSELIKKAQSIGQKEKLLLSALNLLKLPEIEKSQEHIDMVQNMKEIFGQQTSV